MREIFLLIDPMDLRRARYICMYVWRRFRKGYFWCAYGGRVVVAYITNLGANSGKYE